MESSVNREAEGKQLKIATRGYSEKNNYIQSATLNGKPYHYWTLRHHDNANGGELVLKLSDKPGKWGTKMFADK